MTSIATIRRALVAGTLAIAATSCATPAGMPFERTYLSAGHNWAFRKRFPDVDGLLNAFDYGHAALYQTLVTKHDGAASYAETDEFAFITTKLLPNPPNVALDESAIGPEFAKLAPEVLATFDWAHMLHRQLYDVLAAPDLTDAQRDAAVAGAIAYYRARPDLALSTSMRGMDLMEAQPYSLVFRKAAPKYNGLLWSYHWFQMALYDALLAGTTDRERRMHVDETKRRFFDMIASAPSHMPAEMPMAMMAGPVFSKRYPDAANVFDNLHALHDVVADILLSPTIPRGQKRAALLTATAAYRDSSRQ